MQNIIIVVSLSDGDLLIGPCRSQRLGQRQEARTGQGGPGTKGIIKEEPGLKECPVNTRVPNPFFQEGQVRRYRLQPPPPLPPLQGSLGRDPLPPSTELPLPPENYHLGLTSVKTSFRPPNLGQKSWFGHKTTE